MLVFKKEKKVVELIRQHIDVIEECLVKSREVLEHFVSGRIGETAQTADEVDRLETEADDLVREIRDVLYSGAYLPGIRADMYRLVDMVDKIAGHAEEAARFLKCQPPRIPEEYQAEIAETFTISVACYHELKRAMKTFLKPKGKFEKLQERIGQISTGYGQLLSRLRPGP